MPNNGSFLGMALVGLLAIAPAGCHAPRQTQEETRMYPKAPLQHMAPVIKAEPTTAMSRLARFNKPRVVEIPAESTAPAKR